MESLSQKTPEGASRPDLRPDLRTEPRIRRFLVSDATVEDGAVAQIEVSFTSPEEWALTIRGNSREAFARVNEAVKRLPLAQRPAYVTGPDCLAWIEEVLTVAMDGIGQRMEPQPEKAGAGGVMEQPVDFLRDFASEDEGRFPFFGTGGTGSGAA